MEGESLFRCMLFHDMMLMGRALHRLSLKTKLTPNDLHRLIYDVRRRVELEVTFEGHEKNVAYVFLSLLFFVDPSY